MKHLSKNSILRAWQRGALIFIWAAALLLLAVQPQAVTAASSCPAGKRCVFVPIAISPRTEPSTTVDLLAVGMEANQAIQNEANTIPLVAGRETILRIFSKVTGYNTAVSGVRMSITATRSGASLSSAPPVVSATVPLSSSRGDYQSSINFPLPALWTSGTVDITVRLDSDDRVAELNESNNQITQRFVFNNVPPLNVKIVPVQYAHTAAGAEHVYPAPTTDTISSWILRTYPISRLNITWHAPYAFTGNLSNPNEFSRLLNEITALKSSEGAPGSTVYYALVPTSDGNYNWFYGGVAGIGWIGNRTSVGINLSGSATQIAAHEIGHNLGMGHTPCGVSGTEKNFPYSDGSIGQYGLDTSSGTLYPPSSKDVMSYCNPKWVSDYTYRVLYNAQMQYGAYEIPEMQRVQPQGEGAVPGGPSNALMVRATIRNGSVEMSPSYFFSNQQANASASGDYLVQMIGAAGEVLVEQPVQATEMVLETEDSIAGIHAVLPAPDAAVTAVRLLKDGQILAEQPVSSGAAPQVTVDRSETGISLHWVAAQAPMLVRYSVDGGTTWTTLGVDVTGGRLDVPFSALPNPDGIFEVIPGNAQW